MLGHIEYDEYELLELFESEPRTICEDAIGEFTYSKTDNRGIELTLYFSEYENKCSLGLSYSLETHDSPIIDIVLDDVVRFLCTSEKLTVQRKSGRNVEIIFKPNFMLRFDQI